MNGGEVPMIIVKDSYYMNGFTEPTEEPVYKKSEDLMKGSMQLEDTCFFTNQLMGLINGGYQDYIRKVLVKDHPSDKKITYIFPLNTHFVEFEACFRYTGSMVHLIIKLRKL